jgi:hypothetical protein
MKARKEDTGSSNSIAAAPANPDSFSPQATKFFSPAFLFPRSLTAETEVDPNVIVCNVTDDGVLLSDEAKLRDPSFVEPFIATFVTNAKTMVLKIRNGGQFSVGENDVDSDGNVTGRTSTKESRYLEFINQLGLRDNVVIRFVFTG